MTVQQINLYLPELRPKKQWITVNTLLASTVGLVVMLTLIHFYNLRSLRSFDANVITIENQQVVAKQRVEKMKKLPLPSNRNALDNRIEELQRAIKAREIVGFIIEDQNLGNAEGFAAAMDGLARQSINSVALSRIRLSSGGSVVELAGEMRKPEDIPLYLQRIQTEKSFYQSRFGLLSVAEVKEKKNVHQFSLGFDSLFDDSQGGKKK